MLLSRSVIKVEQVENVVLDYTPRKFELNTPEQALQYLEQKAAGSDFRMSDPVRIQTGIADIEAKSFEDTVEEAALNKLKDIQEQAYKEAYQLGMLEGRRDAFQEKSEEIKIKLEAFDQVLLNIANLKSNLITHNESQLIRLVFNLAKKIIQKEVSLDSNLILDLIKNTVSNIDESTEIHAFVSSEQFEFLENLKKESKREFEFLKKIKFTASEEVSVGGFKITTNYGEIDATIEQRLEKVWETLSKSIPKVKAVG